MNRPAWVAAAIGIAALGIGLALSLIGGVRLLPSYLAAWLFCLGIPVGALAVLMALEIAGAAQARLANPLRGLADPLRGLADPLRGVVCTLPVLAVLALPVLLHPGAVFGPHADAPFIVRAAVFLVVWALLSVVFMRPPAREGGPRRGVAVVGLALHMGIATVAANDWAQALDPGLGSSSFGLLLIVSQCSAGVAVAVLLAAWGARGTEWIAPRGLAALLLCLLGAWVFLAFTQFLIVWSANLPQEVAWYQHRSAGFGLALEWTAIGACAAALLGLLARRFEVATVGLALAAGAVLFAHLIEGFWLITPAFRQRMDVTGADLLAVCGLFALLVAASLAFGRWTEDRHGHT